MKDEDQKYFSVQLNFLYYLGVWNNDDGKTGMYSLYSKMFVLICIIFYVSLLTLNLFVMPRILDNYIEELVFYFTELSVMSKVLTFYFMCDKLRKIFATLESQNFQPTDSEGIKIIENARKFNETYWKIVTAISLVSYLVHAVPPVLLYYLGFGKLKLPISSYSFLPEEFKETYIQPLYYYQIICMHFHMWYNVNIDTLFLGLMISIIAQLDILKGKLRKVTNGTDSRAQRNILAINKNNHTVSIKKLNESVIHFDEIYKFDALIQDVFSVTLFIQFCMASCIICICLFRFTMLATWQYYIFLVTYMFIMVIQILVPCWFGTHIIDKSRKLSEAIYDCDWVTTCGRFKSSMRIFVVRMNRPLTLCGWNMFPLSLTTFTSIINTAYSFFTLLRHMQNRDDD